MECGSGDYCNVSVNMYPYAASGNKGVAAGLQNIQLLKHGPRLAGKSSAASDFEALDGDEDEFTDIDESELPDFLKNLSTDSGER